MRIADVLCYVRKRDVHGLHNTADCTSKSLELQRCMRKRGVTENQNRSSCRDACANVASKVCATQLIANQNHMSCTTANEESARNMPGLTRRTKRA